MSDIVPVLTALIGAVAALSGIALALIFQLLFRKEKFKELVYKERFAVYKQLVECAVEIVRLWPVSMVKNMGIMDDMTGGNKLDGELARYPFLLSLAEYIAADQILNPATRFRNLIAVPVKNRDEGRDQYAEITRSQRELTRAVRVDLGVDPLSKDIKKTIHDSFRSIHCPP